MHNAAAVEPSQAGMSAYFFTPICNCINYI